MSTPDDRNIGLDTEPMMQFFAFDHLPPRLQEVSRGFHALAEWVIATLPRNPERTVVLRKLLEAKDCAVRALIWKAPPMPPEFSHIARPGRD